LVETLGYLAYLAIVYNKGEQTPQKKGRGAPTGIGWLAEARTLRGRSAGIALLLGYAVSIMTVSKTVLYWLVEYCSGFAHIGHNGAWDLFWLWILPNGLWLVFPSYMIYVFGREMLQAVECAEKKEEGKSM